MELLSPQLKKCFDLAKNQQHVHIECKEPFPILSSAILNGGMVKADHFVNMKVPRRGKVAKFPEITLEEYCRNAGWKGKCVGMMTAASMDSLVVEQLTVQCMDIAVLVTAGLSNPRCVGDQADFREMYATGYKKGTINIVVLTSGNLSPAAMTEALMIITEAKTVALRNALVKSPVSERVATGTGTDSHGIICAGNSPEIKYCGKHVLFGEILGNLTVDAVTKSIDWYFNE